MPSNIINLNTELASRQDHRALTPKQELMVGMNNNYIELVRLKRAMCFHKLAHKQRSKEFLALAELVELQEEKLMRTSSALK